MSLSHLVAAIDQKDLADIARLGKAAAADKDTLCAALAYAASRGGVMAINELVKLVDVNARSPKAKGGATVLHAAAQAGQPVAAKTLLALGADPLLADAKGALPLHAAARMPVATSAAGWAMACHDTVEALLAAAPEVARVAEPSSRATPLRLLLRKTVSSGSSTDLAALDRVARLLIPFSDVNAKDAKGTTPLIAAAAALNAPVVESLLAAGADANLPDGDNQTAAERLIGDIRGPFAEELRSRCLRLLADRTDFARDGVGVRCLRKTALLSRPWADGFSLFAAPAVSGDAWLDSGKAMNGKTDFLTFLALPQNDGAGRGLLDPLLRARGLSRGNLGSPDEQAALRRLFNRVWLAIDTPQKMVVSPRRPAEDAWRWSSLAALAPWGEGVALSRATDAARRALSRKSSALDGEQFSARERFLSIAEAMELAAELGGSCSEAGAAGAEPPLAAKTARDGSAGSAAWEAPAAAPRRI
jgi:hypothetical protein